MKLQRAEKRKGTETEPSTSKITRRSSGGASKVDFTKCFFCNDDSVDVHGVTMFKLNTRVKECALQLQDTILLAKLSAGDMISQDAVYHKNCLVALCNRAKRSLHENTQENAERQYQGITLRELVLYIEEIRAESTTSIPVFKLTELAKLYSDQLEELGAKSTGPIHTTQLKDHILANIPDMQAHKHSRDVLLAFNEDIGTVLNNAYGCDFDDEGTILSQAARIVRRSMSETKYSFDGTFGKDCQSQSVPGLLLSLVKMILSGSSIKKDSDHINEAQAALTIAQLLQYNSLFRRSSSVLKSSSTYHSTDREPPLMAYEGLLLHAKTRKCGLIDKLYDLGMSVSYDRVLAISTAMGNTVSARFEEEYVVCPPRLRFSLFTTSAVDNIDHNPDSTMAKGSLHGTGISLFQHPSKIVQGEDRSVSIIDDSVSTKKLTPLPDSYANVPPLVLLKKDPVIPAVNGPCTSNGEYIPIALEEENR